MPPLEPLTGFTVSNGRTVGRTPHIMWEHPMSPRKSNLELAQESMQQQISRIEEQVSSLAELARNALEARPVERTVDEAPQGEEVELSPEEQLELERLRRENRELKAMGATAGAAYPGLRIHPSGSISLYGLGRNPVSLYKEQWKRLNERMAGVMEFIDANEEHPDIVAADERHAEAKQRKRAFVELQGGTPLDPRLREAEYEGNGG